MRSLRRGVVTIAAAIALILGTAAACFSDRTVTAGEEGECRFPVDAAIPGSTVVVIRRFTFEPAEVRVAAGERVTWVNCDEDPHTSTADEGAWSSPLLVPGDAFTQVFDESGEFAYHCEPHPFMTGRVVVE